MANVSSLLNIYYQISSTYVIDIGTAKTSWGFVNMDNPLQTFTSNWNYKKNEGWDNKPCNLYQMQEECCPHPLLPIQNYPEFLSVFTKKTYDNFNGSNSGRNITIALSKNPIIQALTYINNFYDGQLTFNDSRLLLTEPTNRSIAGCKALTEICFETFDVSAYFPIKKASATAFASGKSTGTIVEIGPLGTIISPVFEGYNLSQLITTYAIGKELFNWYIAVATELYNAESKNFNNFWPFYTHKSNSTLYTDIEYNIHSKYLHYAQNTIVDDIVNSYIKFEQYPILEDIDEDEDDDLPTYELPDGKLIQVPQVLNSTLTEYMFAPKNTNDILYNMKKDNLNMHSSIQNWPGLPTAIYTTIFKCDPELINIMATNIMCNGHLTSLPGFYEILSTELLQLNSIDCADTNRWNYIESQFIKDVSSIKPKPTSCNHPDKNILTWIGSSTVGMLASFETYWLTKAEFAECGSNILDRKLIF